MAATTEANIRSIRATLDRLQRLDGDINAETRKLRDTYARLLGQQEEEALYGPLPSPERIEENEIAESPRHKSSVSE